MPGSYRPSFASRLPAPARRVVTAIQDGAGQAIAATGRTADRAFALTGIAPQRLEIPEPVRQDIQVMFAGTVDPDALVVRAGHLPGIPHTRAFALPAVIYLAQSAGIRDRTGPDGQTRPRATPLLVHELVHAWQAHSMGPRYVVRALYEQLRYRSRAYDWQWWLGPGGMRHFADLPVEAQAQLVMHAYAGGRIPNCPPAFDASCGAVAGGCAPSTWNEPLHAAVLAEALDAIGTPHTITG